MTTTTKTVDLADLPKQEDDSKVPETRKPKYYNITVSREEDCTEYSKCSAFQLEADKILFDWEGKTIIVPMHRDVTEVEIHPIYVEGV